MNNQGFDIVSLVSDAFTSYMLHADNNLGTKYHPLRVQCFIEQKTESRLPIDVLDVIPSPESTEMLFKVGGKKYGIRVSNPGFRHTRE
jgi:hypothetical protein